MAGRGEDHRRPLGSHLHSGASAPQNTAGEPSSLSAAAPEFVSGQSSITAGRTRPPPNESVHELGVPTHISLHEGLSGSQSHPLDRQSSHDLTVQHCGSFEGRAHGLGASRYAIGMPRLEFTSPASRYTDAPTFDISRRVQPSRHAEDVTRPSRPAVNSGNALTSLQSFNTFNIPNSVHPSINASSLAPALSFNALPSSISMPSNMNGLHYGTATTLPAAQVVPAQHATHHFAGPSADSAFSQPASQSMAELIRSGRAENDQNLNQGVVGPRIARDARGQWYALPEPDLPSTNPDGPMPPPVQGFSGAIRPRYGHASLQSSAGSGVVAVADTNGPAAAFLGTTEDALPLWAIRMQQVSYQPKLQEVMQDLPFIEACRAAVPSTAAVVKIKNPPYLTNRAEILAFAGYHANICAQPPGSQYFAVHIITNRFNGATMDAYIELPTMGDAMRMVRHFERRRRDGKPVMIGDRECFVLLSSQEELMEEMFPRAKFTSWQGAGPKVSGLTPMYYSDKPSTGFDGFFDPEELHHMSKYAEVPQRSPYANKCHIRVYETLISVLHKYPWSAPELILMREREALFDEVRKAIRALIILLGKLGNHPQDNKTEPTPIILQELVVAVLTCPGFSEVQKAKVILDVANTEHRSFLSSRGMGICFGGVHDFAKHWPFKALVMKPSAPAGLVEQVIALLKQAMVVSDVVSAFEACSMADYPNRFPDLDIDYSHAKTLADVAVIEKQHIEGLLRLFLLPMDRTPRKVHTFSS